jgi:hypothetical protein
VATESDEHRSQPFKVEGHTPSSRTHLFTVRVWREDMGDGQWEWRGKVQHVLSGEAFYFREWQELIAHVKTALQKEHTSSK